MPKHLLTTKTYAIPVPRQDRAHIEEVYLVDVVHSADGDLLALDVRTDTGRRVLPGMRALAAVVKDLADNGTIMQADAIRYTEKG